ncbi:MAG: hypothetical protein LC798_05285 [Chloroflexi bacterium]|nr:hypothetical protein [Chloroflexota bacterium]
MIANARWGAYTDWPIAHPVRMIAPRDAVTEGMAAHIGSIPRYLTGVTNDENVQRESYPSANRGAFRDPARPATHEPTYYLRNMFWRRWRFDGSHGVIAALRPGTWGDRQTPLRRPNRTLRSAPSSPWDVGTAIGPLGYATGGEGE